jgi:hypothetical protein
MLPEIFTPGLPASPPPLSNVMAVIDTRAAAAAWVSLGTWLIAEPCEASGAVDLDAILARHAHEWVTLLTTVIERISELVQPVLETAAEVLAAPLQLITGSRHGACSDSHSSLFMGIHTWSDRPCTT